MAAVHGVGGNTFGEFALDLGPVFLDIEGEEERASFDRLAAVVPGGGDKRHGQRQLDAVARLPGTANDVNRTAAELARLAAGR